MSQGELGAGQDFFARTEVQLRAGMRRGAQLPWPARAAHRARSLAGRSRALAVVAVGLLVAGPALAATGIIRVGSSVPPARHQSSTSGNGVALHTGVQLTALRVADPDGGAAWGMRLAVTTRGEVCAVVGRVVDGRIGVLGIDGAFKDDGLFHPYASNSPNYTYDGTGCAPLGADGSARVFDTSFGAPASGSLNGLRCSVSSTGRAALNAIRRKHHLPVPPAGPICPAADVRDIWFGLLGPAATEIAYREPDGTVRVEHTVGAYGAYLVVLPHSAGNGAGSGDGPFINNPPIVGIVTRSGLKCGVLGPKSASRSLIPCERGGYTPPQVIAPSAATVRAPLTVRPIPGQPGERSVSFIARVGVTSTRSYYATWLVGATHRDPGDRRPTSCGVGLGGATDRDLRAGQRITFRAGPQGPCYGLIHGIVEFVVDRGAQAGPYGHAYAVTPSTNAGPDVTVRIVGHFSFTVPPKHVSLGPRHPSAGA